MLYLPSTYINSTASLIKMQWTPHPSSQKLRAFFMRFCGNCKCTHIHMTRRLSERMAATKVCFLYLCLNVRKHNLGLNLLQISPSCLLMFIIISFNLGISCMLTYVLSWYSKGWKLWFRKQTKILCILNIKVP